MQKTAPKPIAITTSGQGNLTTSLIIHNSSWPGMPSTALWCIQCGVRIEIRLLRAGIQEWRGACQDGVRRSRSTQANCWYWGKKMVSTRYWIDLELCLCFVVMLCFKNVRHILRKSLLHAKMAHGRKMGWILRKRLKVCLFSQNKIKYFSVMCINCPDIITNLADEDLPVSTYNIFKI